MKKTSLILIACLATVLSACESGVKTDEIEGGETPIATPPAPKKPAPKKPDEVIAPEKPKAPPKAPEAKKPTEPKKPEEKKPDEVAKKPAETKKPEKKPEEKKPDGGGKPIFIGRPDRVPLDLIPVTPLEKEKTMTFISRKNITVHDCDHCSSSGGEAHDYLCPSNYVVTGYELGVFGEESYPDYDYATIATLRITCAPPTPLNIDHKQTDYAQDYDGNFIAGTRWLDARRADSCAAHSGVATGVFGRSGERLDSFGFLCGPYETTKTSIKVYKWSDPKTTYQRPGSPFGGAPGIGGKPFSAICPDDKVLAGLRIRSDTAVEGINMVYGIEAIYCADLVPLF